MSHSVLYQENSQACAYWNLPVGETSGYITSAQTETTNSAWQCLSLWAVARLSQLWNLTVETPLSWPLNHNELPNFDNTVAVTGYLQKSRISHLGTSGYY